MAFVYDASGHFTQRLNGESVMAQRLASAHWESELQQLIALHHKETGSPRAEEILKHWAQHVQHFWQVCPKEMVARLAHPLQDDAPLAQRA
jgi:glutamate synthase (NADPH/NADH) large chain